MGREWPEVTLGEVVTLQRGFDLPSHKRQPGNIPIVSSSGISDFHAEYAVKGPGVVTGRYGTIGQVFLIENDYWPLNTTLWVKDFHGNDPRFASYLLRTIDFMSCSDKSSVPGVNRNDLHQLVVRLPPVNQQKAIAAILGALDDKIELNRRMNATLEAMARALFQSWFVDFDPVRAKVDGRRPVGMDEETAALFPNSFETSETLKSPSGWKGKSIRDLASSIQYGLTQSAKQLPPGPKFLRITDIRGGAIDWSTVPHCDVTSEEFEKYRICDGDIFVARTGASTGENTYVISPPLAVFASYLVRFQFASPAVSRFIAEFMRTQLYAEHVAGSVGGSAQPNASAQLLAAATLVTPPVPVIEAYFGSVHILDLKRVANGREMVTLAALRDTLLPKLLSGELSVKAAEELVA